MIGTSARAGTLLAAFLAMVFTAEVGPDAAPPGGNPATTTQPQDAAATPATAPAASEATNAPAATTAPTAGEAAVPRSGAAASRSAPAMDAAGFVIYPTVTLSNRYAVAVVSTQRGSLDSLALADVHPIALPKPLQHQLGEEAKPESKDTPLAVLAPLRVPDSTKARYDGTNQHNWIVVQGGPGGLGSSDDAPWTIAASSPTSATLRFAKPEGLIYEITYALAEDRPALSCTFVVRNPGSAPVEVEPQIVPLNGIHQDYPANEAYYLHAAVHHGGADGALDANSLPGVGETGKPILGTADLDYIALKSRFFAAIWMPRALAPAAAAPAPAHTGPSGPSGPAGPAGPAASTAPAASGPAWSAAFTGFTGLGNAHQAHLAVQYARQTIAPGGQLDLGWTLTISSTDKAHLALLSPAEQRLQYADSWYKFFRILADFLTWCLTLVQLAVRNYGVAVIVLTCLIKLALHRTTYKQQASMHKMSALAPQLKYIQEKYKDDRQKLAMEQMALWKKHGVNPVGGCLPMLIQMPIFIALYQAFSHNAALRGERFLWINDLTLPDALVGLGFSWPKIFFPGWAGMPAAINPLPLLYMAITVYMSLSMKPPQNADPQQEQMAKMMRWMPIVFGLFFYYMPSGLVLYFTVSALISLIETRYIKRKLGVNTVGITSPI